jgi:polar amino acid transport system permease protein
MTGFSWDWNFAREIVPYLIDGLKVTVQATFFGTLLALVLGLIWTILRLAEIPVVSRIFDFIVQFLRGTPFLIQLYFLFYALPQFGLSMSPLLTGVIGLGLFYGAVASEVYRAGIENVAPSQWEACLSLGLPIPWVWSHIILPQAVRAVLPVLGNIVVVMFKDTALLSVITVSELLGNARDAAQMEYRFIEPLTMAAGLYLIVSYASVRGIRRLERWSVAGG